jgi:hypothetical protein
MNRPLPHRADGDGELQQALGLRVEGAGRSLFVDEIPGLAKPGKSTDELTVTGGRLAGLLRGAAIGHGLFGPP